MSKAQTDLGLVYLRVKVWLRDYGGTNSKIFNNDLEQLLQCAERELGMQHAWIQNDQTQTISQQSSKS